MASGKTPTKSQSGSVPKSPQTADFHGQAAIRKCFRRLEQWVALCCVFAAFADPSLLLTFAETPFRSFSPLLRSGNGRPSPSIPLSSEFQQSLV